jgi:hypothetical protein
MVDINLMGDEENREERQPDEGFTQTVNLDFGDTAEEEKPAPFVNEPPPSSYAREPRETVGGGYSTRPLAMNANAGSSRNKAYLLVAALIIAALVAVYLMIPKSSKQTATPTDITNVDLTPDSSATTDLLAPVDSGTAATTTEPANTLASSEPPPPNVETRETENMPPLASSMFSSTRIGAYTIGALGQSFSGDNDFSLLSYSGNNNSFLVQFMSPSEAAIDEATQAMQRNASPQELRTVSKLPADGGAISNVLVLGRVSERAAMMGPQGQQRMSFTEFSTWLKKLGADRGLRLNLYEVGKAYASDGGGTRTPVQANFSGDKASAFDFLKGLADAGPNISTSKIIVSPADYKSSSSAKVKVVLLFDFIE